MRFRRHFRGEFIDCKCRDGCSARFAAGSGLPGKQFARRRCS